MYSLIGDLPYYLTACYCLLNVDSGKLIYCSAGHHPALVDRPGRSTSDTRPEDKIGSQRLIELNCENSFFIGIEPDFPSKAASFNYSPAIACCCLPTG